MHHDATYLAPAFLALDYLGIKKLIAVPRESPRSAAEKLSVAIRQGFSTYIAPDGPRGPEREPKPGVFHLSKDSGRPIIALKLSCDRALSWPSWDQKLIPLPFSRITIEYSEPYQVTENNFEEAKEWLMTELA